MKVDVHILFRKHCKPLVGALGQRSLSVSAGSKSSHLRTAHTAELFRSSFYDFQGSCTSVSVSDLDEMVKDENIRPSLLMYGFSTAGKGLGLITKMLPKTYSELITNVVDDATIQHFNDSIGAIQLDENDKCDIKETLKFHRDINSGGGDNNTVKASNVVLTAGLYKFLDLAKYI